MFQSLNRISVAAGKPPMRIRGLLRFSVRVCCLLAIGALALGCSTTKEPTAETDLENVQVRIYEVFGMDCPGCHGAVEKIVKKIPGVVGASANWKEKRLTVKLQDGIELADEEIFAAIKRANFTPGERLQ